mgnify:CR=1 FL=1
MTTARYSRAVNVEAPGVRGQGFRDTTQDMIAMCCREPEMAEKMLLRLLLPLWLWPPLSFCGWFCCLAADEETTDFAIFYRPGD